MSSGWLPPQPPDDGAPAPERPDTPVTPYGAPRPTFVKQSEAPGGPSNPPATASVVVGSIALAVLLLSLGTTFFLTVPASVVGLVLAMAARRRIEAGLTAAGRGPAQAGKVIAWIGIAAGILAGIVWVILIASGFSFDDLREELERELERQQDGGGNGTRI